MASEGDENPEQLWEMAPEFAWCVYDLHPRQTSLGESV